MPLAAIIIGVLVFSFMGLRAANFDPEVDGFGRNWQSFKQVNFDGRLVKSSPEDVVDTSLKWQADGVKVTLWLGASQLHTISAANEGEKIAVYYANRHAITRDAMKRYVQLSNGNANLYEFLANYLNVRKMGFTPNELIVAVTFDDFRETGVRKGLRLDVDDSLTSMGGVGFENLLKKMDPGDVVESVSVERNVTDGTPQEELEQRLLPIIEEIWPPYLYRQQLKGLLEIAWKEQVTRIVLGSKRRNSVKVNRDLEDYQFHALDAIRRIAELDQTHLVIYRAPLLKQDDFSYYVIDDYQQFGERLSIYCEQHGITYRDLDNLVPNELYGMTNSGLPDYFHFNGRGHKILARSVDGWLAELER